MIDQEVYEQQFIQNSSQSLDQFISYGNTILGNLHEQKDTFTVKSFFITFQKNQ